VEVTMTLGRFLGWLIVTGYLLTVLDYFVKLINRKVISKKPPDSQVRKNYMVFMRIIVKYHRYFALGTTIILLVHFIVQYLVWGFYVTGLIAASILILQGCIGAYGTIVRKKKSGPWLYAHRTLAVLLPVAILIHILTVEQVLHLF
jgi:hypothetical protein